MKIAYLILTTATLIILSANAQNYDFDLLAQYNELSLKFNASKEAIKMKLISKSLLKDTTHFLFKKLLNDLK